MGAALRLAPSGRLTLLVGGQYGVGHRSWNDGQRNKIETMLGDIVVGLEQAVREIQEHDRRNEESRRQSALAERRRWHEDGLGKDLDSMVERWTKATRIRGFLAAVEEGAPAELREHEGFGRWLAWAKARADGLDPLTKPAEIAKVVDRDLLDE